MSIEPPIILNETRQPGVPGDISFFDTIERAVQYVEPVDVENCEYEVFDIRGQLLALTVRDDLVELTGTGIINRNGLISLLEQHLPRCEAEAGRQEVIAVLTLARR